MRRFSRWFSSPAGVVETFVVTIVIVIIEHIWPRLDPNGFLLLYWLTVYSGVTQQPLAYAARIAADESSATQAQIHKLQESHAQMLRNQTDMMRAIIAIAERIEHGVEEIAEDLREEDEVATNAHRAAVQRRENH